MGGPKATFELRVLEPRATIVPKCIQRCDIIPFKLQSSPNCLHDISNPNIYIPIKRLFFKNVQYPTLCPKGTKKPFQFTIIPQVLPCFIQSQYIYSMHTYSPPN